MTANTQIATGVIIAGGLSSRFNLNEPTFIHKALSFFKGMRLIDFIVSTIEPYCNEILIIVNNAKMKSEFEDQISSIKDYSNVEIVIDQPFAEVGSLRGILTGFYYARSPYIFVTACDTLISTDILQLLLDHLSTTTGTQASAVFYDNGIIEPNILAIRKPIARSLLDILKETNRNRITDVIRCIDHIMFFKLTQTIPTIKVKDDLVKLDSEEDDNYKPSIINTFEYANNASELFIKSLNAYKNNDITEYKILLRQEIKIWENTPFRELLLYILVDLRNFLAADDPEVAEIKEKVQQLRDISY